jgi:biotin synthase
MRHQAAMRLDTDDVLSWLRTTNPSRLARLWRRADEVRRRHVGQAVHLRGLIEFSNCCGRDCWYCGLRQPNKEITRYHMTEDEVMRCVREAVDRRYGTVVLQSGENHGVDWLAGLIQRIKSETPLAVTISIGEQTPEELRSLKLAGADRYLLRFETSNRGLFRLIHPPICHQEQIDRVNQLRWLRDLGYEVGSGVMIGIPGQTYQDLANDIELFRQLDLDMIGVGPYIPVPGTPLYKSADSLRAGPAEQVPNTDQMTLKVIALSRLLCPLANIPSTTALATINRANGWELGLKCGANVLMPNLTAAKYREAYAIYPSKAGIAETSESSDSLLRVQIRALGRTIGCGRGDSPNIQRQSRQTSAT